LGKSCFSFGEAESGEYEREMALSINIAGGFPEGFRCDLPRDAGVGLVGKY